MDERAAAYQALGYAKGKKEGAALLCTSGTAAANYYPAVIEAYHGCYPLFIISTDRPFELIYAGANQVMEQSGLFGIYVKKCLHFPAPTTKVSLAAVQSYIHMMVEKARQAPFGPVHINLPFREPLEPSDGKDIDPRLIEYVKNHQNRNYPRRPSPCFEAHREPHRESLERLALSINGAKRGLLLVGALCEEDKKAVYDFCQKLAWPVYLDITAPSFDFSGKNLTLLDIGKKDAFLSLKDYRPDVIIHIGKRLVSKWFDSFIESSFHGEHFVISGGHSLQVPSHYYTQRIYASPARVCGLLIERCQSAINSSREHEALAHSQSVLKEDKVFFYENLKHFSFAHIACHIARFIPKEHGLFLGNSLSIRAFDYWQKALALEYPSIDANRGVSGIEGLLATSLGLLKARKSPMTVVLGDVSLIHDLNSLLEIVSTGIPIVIVVVNNFGGGIFKKLPIKNFTKILEPHLTTPHSFNFRGICQMAHLSYELVDKKEAFKDAYKEFIASKKQGLIECHIFED